MAIILEVDVSKIKKITKQSGKGLSEQQPCVWRIVANFSTPQDVARLLQATSFFNKDRARLQPFGDYLKKEFRSNNPDVTERYEEDKRSFIKNPFMRKTEHLFDDVAGKNYVAKKIKSGYLWSVKDELFSCARASNHPIFLLHFSSLFYSTKKLKFKLSIEFCFVFLINYLALDFSQLRGFSATSLGVFARKQIAVSSVKIFRGMRCLREYDDVNTQQFITRVIERYESQKHVLQSDATRNLLADLRSGLSAEIKKEEIDWFMRSGAENQGGKMYCILAKELADLQAPQQSAGTQRATIG